MARPRKDPTDPKWAVRQDAVQNVGSSEQVPTNCKVCAGKCKAPAPTAGNDDLMVAVLMAGYIARGGGVGYEMMLRQARELTGVIKGAV